MFAGGAGKSRQRFATKNERFRIPGGDRRDELGATRVRTRAPAFCFVRQAVNRALIGQKIAPTLEVKACVGRKAARFSSTVIDIASQIAPTFVGHVRPIIRR
jgi:hypothetical protein